MTTLADEECRSDYFADRPERDLPGVSELGDEANTPPRPRRRVHPHEWRFVDES